MNVLGIIPARGGSRRVPRKNLCTIAGKTLVARAIEAARSATRIDRLVVSSDSDEILAIAASYDPALALRRPPELSTETALAIEYVRHALAELGRPQGPEDAEGAQDSRGERFDAVAIIQPSSPFTLAEDIDATIDLLDRSGADSAVTVVQLDQVVHPFKLKTLDGDRLRPYLEPEKGRMAAHEIPTIYARNGSVYVTRVSTVERGDLLGEDSRAVVMPRERSVDINDPLDLRFAEFLASASESASAGPEGRTPGRDEGTARGG